jgi:diguanylate cyclase (GGDEF)-like protein
MNQLVNDIMAAETPQHIPQQSEIQPKAEWHETTELAVADAYRGGAPVSVVLFDLDGFKSVNDSLGHGTGDRVIDDFGNVILPGVIRNRSEDPTDMRPFDVIGRTSDEEAMTPGHVGGDEFALLVRGPAEAAQAIAHRVRTAFEAYLEEPVNAGLKELEISTSYGVATLDTVNQMTKSDMLSEADKALYDDKLRNVRGLSDNQIKVFHEMTAKMIAAGLRLRDIPKIAEVHGTSPEKPVSTDES